MAKLFCIKVDGVLRPSTEWAEETLAKIKNGTQVQVEIKQPRNIQFHRLFFAMIKLAHQNQDHYETPELLLVALKVALGHVETVIAKDGNTVYIPKSISFAKMDELEFRDFFDHAADLIVKHMLQGTDKEDFKREVEAMLS